MSSALIRPIVAGDFDDILALAQQADGGMTNLPKDEAALRARIDFILHSYDQGGKAPNGETYMMVLQLDGRILGTTAVFSAVGLESGFINYKIVEEFHRSQELDRRTHRRVMIPSHDFTGAAEVGSLFLAKDARGGGYGKLLARARYLFMAQSPEIVDDHVCAELRGWRAPDGTMPFWEALGARFFDMEFEKADLHNSAYGNQFIQDLLPRHPVYESLLSDEARACMGKPHDNAKPAYEMLMAEGFEFNNYIDIFDGGPLVDCPLKRIKTVRDSTLVTVAKIVDANDDLKDAEDYLAATGAVRSFKCARIPLQATTEFATISSEAAKTLAVAVGDKIRIVPW